MAQSIFFKIPMGRRREVTDTLLNAIPSTWVMIDGPIERHGCALYCKRGEKHEHEARCHIVPIRWTGSFLAGREEGPQPPRIKLRGSDEHIGPLVALCVSLGLTSYEPRRQMTA